MKHNYCSKQKEKSQSLDQSRTLNQWNNTLTPSHHLPSNKFNKIVNPFLERPRNRLPDIGAGESLIHTQNIIEYLAWSYKVFCSFHFQFQHYVPNHACILHPQSYLMLPPKGESILDCVGIISWVDIFNNSSILVSGWVFFNLSHNDCDGMSFPGVSVSHISDCATLCLM